MKKKVFSILIALAIVLAMMPLAGTSVSAAAEAKKVTFTLGGYGYWDGAPAGWEKEDNNYIKTDGVAAGTPVSDILAEWEGYEPLGRQSYCDFEGWEASPGGSAITGDTTFTATFRCRDHHTFGPVSYDWSNLPECTASTVCEDCGQVLSETKTAIFTETTKASVIGPSYGSYYVNFNDSRFRESQQTGVGPDGPLQHVFTAGMDQTFVRGSSDDLVFKTNADGPSAGGRVIVYLDGFLLTNPNSKVEYTNTEAVITIFEPNVSQLADGKHTLEAKLDGVDNVATTTFTVAHTMTEHKRIEPTVLADGSKEYYECTHCHKYFEDKEGTKEITEDIDTWKVIPKLTHEIIEGADATYELGSGTALIFKSNGIHDGYFSGVLVDGEEIDAANYTHEAGSIKVTLLSAYLDTLAPGEHALAIRMTGASDAQTAFTVSAADTHVCVDKDNDHKCDICGEVLSECADNDSDHKCDICGKVLSDCADNDSDHKCDICGKVLSDCADNDSDHKCDICGKVLSDCADNDNDHKCDICGKDLGGGAGNDPAAADPDAADTGDYSSILPYAIAMVLALAVIVFLSKRRKEN